ncbi:Mitogen-activated protein kinase kinase kinase 7 [Lamellibrachia satsuma]|nr:Mitogen-activated protein kinase kinase kinase 7 [Lamellibrachia satsuma]
MEIPHDFVEEIDFEELQFLEVVGRGAFGVVSRATWRGYDVAVKQIETESERKAFITELKQLSRVCHPAIVKLYGACTQLPSPVCLVMEYAEGGSLYNVLHGADSQPSYTAAHAMSWCLQVATGVEYLHGMRPKALIHRDLKPPNLLLINCGTELKICDFGTACEPATHMTNNKGSAAWMAPEVFEGSNYSEKCDIFSWGIILWEVLTRRKPFDEIGGPAFRIMWAVHNGTRPPLIKGCPPPLQVLMTKCWSSNPMERPSMSEVVRIMSHLASFYPGSDQPLGYPAPQISEERQPRHPSGSSSDTPPTTNPLYLGREVRQTLRESVTEMWQHNQAGERVPFTQPATPKAKPIVVEEFQDTKASHRRTSAPASLAASRESLLDKSGSRCSTPSNEFINKRYSADLSRLEEIDIIAHGNSGISAAIRPQVQGHRRTGSHGNPIILTSLVSATSLTLPVPTPSAVRGHRRSGSYGNTPVSTAATPSSPDGTTIPAGRVAHSSTVPTSLNTAAQVPIRSISWASGSVGATAGPIKIQGPPVSTVAAAVNFSDLHMDYVAMDHQLQPLAPCTTCPESMAIYEEHCKLAQEYLRIQTEIALLTQRKQELTQERKNDEIEEQCTSRLIDEYQLLSSENESLDLLHKSQKKKKKKEKKKKQHPAKSSRK